MSTGRPLARAGAAAIVFFACGVTLLACGSGEDGAIARIDGFAVTPAMLDSRISVLAPGGLAPDPPRFKRCVGRLEAQSLDPVRAALLAECREQYRALQLRALDSLIVSRWLVVEADERGLRSSGADTVAAARAAESALLRMLRAQTPKMMSVEAQAYYSRNIARYEWPERRYIEIAERIPTRKAAQASLNDVRRRGAKLQTARDGWVLHESFDREDFGGVVLSKRAILEAIFAAAPRTLVGPLPLNGQWSFFEVTRVIPRAVKPFAAVRPSIEHQLAAEREHARLAAFVAAWRRKWTARTQCSSGYVVQRCSEYHGPRAPEDPTFFG